MTLTRDQIRSARPRDVRARTESIKRIPRRRIKAMERLRDALYPEPHWRPRTRRDCVEAGRPCPYVGCRYHLYLDVARNGSIKFNFPDLEPWQLSETCALDAASRGGSRLEDVGARMNITRERVRQIEGDAKAKLHQRLPLLREFAP